MLGEFDPLEIKTWLANHPLWKRSVKQGRFPKDRHLRLYYPWIRFSSVNATMSTCTPLCFILFTRMCLRSETQTSAVAVRGSRVRPADEVQATLRAPLALRVGTAPVGHSILSFQDEFHFVDCHRSAIFTLFVIQR